MGQAQSARWHKGINEMEITDSSIGPPHDLPLSSLQEITNSCLRPRNLRRLAPSERDARLTTLVTESSRRYLAIAACAHVLSPKTVRNLLHQLPLKSSADIQRYLQTIIAVSNANNNVVTDAEAEYASALLQLSIPDVLSIGRNLTTIAALLTSGTLPPELISSTAVQEIPKRASKALFTELERLKEGSEWEVARKATVWLWSLSGTYPDVEQMLDQSFRDWRKWVTWKPNANRTTLWTNLSPRHRRELKDILGLEGPDFLNGKNTLSQSLKPVIDVRGGYRVSNGQFHVKLEDSSLTSSQDTLESILRVLDVACSRSVSEIALFVYVSKHRQLDAEIISILHHSFACKDPPLSSSTQELLNSNVENYTPESVQGMLVNFNGLRCERLRELLTSEIVNIIEGVMSRLQDEVRGELVERRAGGPVMELHSLGMAVREALWLTPSLNEGLRSTLGQWPSTQCIDAFSKLRRDVLKLRCGVRGKKTSNSSSLLEVIDHYLAVRMAGADPFVQYGDKSQVEILLELWHRTPYSDTRAAALTIAQHDNIPISIRCQCLGQLRDMRVDFVRKVIMYMTAETVMACVNFTELLMSKYVTKEVRAEWKGLLLWMISKEDRLLEYTLNQFDLASWFKWLRNIRAIFQDRLYDDGDGMPILGRALHDWTNQLYNNYLPTLTRLEERPKSETAMRWILVGWEEAGTIIPLLKTLKDGAQGLHQEAIQETLAKLAPNQGNFREVFIPLSLITRTTKLGMDSYTRILHHEKNTSKLAAEGFLACFLRDDEMTRTDNSALVALGTVLELQTTELHSPIPATQLEAALDHLHAEFEEIIDEAERLENIRLTLNNHDPQKTATLAANLGFENSSIREDLPVTIPESLVDVLEKTGGSEYEISFPLTHLSPMQRTALGVGNARILIIRLDFTDDSDAPSFCIHVWPEQKTPSLPSRQLANDTITKHTTWPSNIQSSPPDGSFCCGEESRAIYQLNRELWRHLVGGFQSFEVTHQAMNVAFDCLGTRCLVCGSTLSAKLVRSTTCQKMCSLLLRKSGLAVRLADLRHDPAVIDLLVAAVNAAKKRADSNRSITYCDLLPGYPVQAAAGKTAINALPAPGTLKTVPDLATAVKLLGHISEAILSWVCTSYRGFLASATGVLKIPSMPGVHQFVLASASPEKEQAFAMHDPASSIVVFHGTSLDRLYIILRNGLRVLSNTNLQATGAAYGPGIYVASEPRTAWTYARADPGWPSSSLKNLKVLLGCELRVAPPEVCPGIRVVTNETQLMVRYVFLCPPAMAMPIAAHVAPAMSIAFNSLRSGAV
jgi:hypothetical protein